MVAASQHKAGLGAPVHLLWKVWELGVLQPVGPESWCFVVSICGALGLHGAAFPLPRALLMDN